MNLLDKQAESPFLIGEQVVLRPLREEDAHGNYPAWLNDADVSRGNSHHVYPYTRQQALEYIRSLSGRRDLLVLAVVEAVTGMHVGNISLQNINFVNRSAELAILLGEKSCWGKGLGREGATLLVQHAFTALNLHRVELGTPATNEGMQHVAQAIGMRHEGTKRAAFYKDGTYFDVLLYGVLCDEFVLPRQCAEIL